MHEAAARAARHAPGNSGGPVGAQNVQGYPLSAPGAIGGARR